MNIIHVMNGKRARRLLTPAVIRSASVMPVVVVTGARQAGKSTLVRDLLPESRLYLTLDDLELRDQATRRPKDLLARAPKMILDEVQRVPELLLEVKAAVDRDRVPGQFILTSSANLLLMSQVSESLAGRAAYVSLWPLVPGELAGTQLGGLWAGLFSNPAERWPELIAAGEPVPADWRDLARAGGYPVPALHLESPADRAIWFDGYVQSYLERDLQDLSAIGNLIDFRRLMTAVCLRIGSVANQTEIGRDLQLPQPTVRRWLNLLEASYQLVRLPAYAVNRTKRLIKSPKLYWSDAGLALHLARSTEPTGAHLETLVLMDLLAWRDALLSHRPTLHYWRTSDGAEVDFVVEQGQDLIGVEVKSTTRPTSDDARHLFTFRDEYGSAVRGSLLLHAGDRTEWLGEKVLAVPWWSVC